MTGTILFHWQTTVLLWYISAYSKSYYTKGAFTPIVHLVRTKGKKDTVAF